jgi:hypothetical protein
MMFWILGGALFVLICVGGLWWYAEYAPVQENFDE